MLDRLVKITDPLGNASRYGYDPNGNRTAITDALGQVTALTYDALNRLTATTDPLGETATTDLRCGRQRRRQHGRPGQHDASTRTMP